MYQLIDLVTGKIVMKGSLTKIADHQKINIDVLKLSVYMNAKILNGRYKVIKP